MTASKSQILSRILFIAAGGYFLFSAYAKTVPVAYFEFTISEQLPLGDWTVSGLARLLIGLEAALGLCMVCGITGKRKWVPRTAVLLILLFTVHLLLLLFRVGDDVNCGCMGVIAPMRPSWSILKNIVLLLALGVAIRYSKPVRRMEWNLLSLGLTIVFMVLPFMLFPIEEKPDFPAAQLKEATASEGTALDYHTGRHMVSLMSLGCNHCRKAAVRMQEIKAQAPGLPLQVIFYKSDDSTEQATMLEDFMVETGMTAVPYRFIEKGLFSEILRATGETGVPAIYWLDQGRVERSLSLSELNRSELEHWLSGTPAE